MTNTCWLKSRHERSSNRGNNQCCDNSSRTWLCHRCTCIHYCTRYSSNWNWKVEEETFYLSYINSEYKSEVHGTVGPWTVLEILIISSDSFDIIEFNHFAMCKIERQWPRMHPSKPGACKVLSFNHVLQNWWLISYEYRTFPHSNAKNKIPNYTENIVQRANWLFRFQ